MVSRNPLPSGSAGRIPVGDKENGTTAKDDSDNQKGSADGRT
jgi:hypothetical protein